MCQRVVETSDGAAMLVPCSLGQMIALLRRAELVIAGDTVRCTWRRLWADRW